MNREPALDDDEQSARPRDRHFNPWRTARSEAAKEVLADILNQLQNYESYKQLRQRARRPEDQRNFEMTVEAVICELIYHYLSGAEGGVSITRSNRVLGSKDRYRPPTFGKILPDVLDRLAAPEMGFIEQQLGAPNPFAGNLRTTITPGRYLLSRITKYSLEIGDLGQSDQQEVIILKRPKADFWDDGDYQDYEDTSATRKFRDQMRTINRLLADAEISFDDSEAPERIVDSSDRLLRRIFARGKFNSGGRLFGGFWQTLKKAQRLSGIEISGEPVIELDYAQMAPTILYGLERKTPPAGDLYAVPGYEFNRESIKKLLNAMIFSEQRLSRMPQGVRKQFSDRRSVQHVMAEIENFHSRIKYRFFCGYGHRLQFIESSILVDVLLGLRDQGVVALPIHDAILVPASSETLSRDAMIEAFRKHVGSTVEVTKV